jgi:hypothetical protein
MCYLHFYLHEVKLRNFALGSNVSQSEYSNVKIHVNFVSSYILSSFTHTWWNMMTTWWVCETSHVLYLPYCNAAIGMVTCNILIPAPHRSCMTHWQMLTATATIIIHTIVQLCPTSCQVLTIVCVVMVQYTVEQCVFLLWTTWEMWFHYKVSEKIQISQDHSSKHNRHPWTY